MSADAAEELLELCKQVNRCIGTIREWPMRYSARFHATVVAVNRAHGNEEQQLFHTLYHAFGKGCPAIDKVMVNVNKIKCLLEKHFIRMPYDRYAAKEIVTTILSMREIDEEGTLEGLRKLL